MMRIVDSKVAWGVVALCVVAWAVNAEAQNRCTSAKTKLAGKKAAAILKCYSKASLHGAPVDAACVQRARDKFASGSQRADTRQDPGNPVTVCPNGSGDAAIAESIVDVHVDDVAAELDPGFPSFALSQCTAKKLTCAGKKDAVILGCHAKALAKGLAVDPQCVSAAETKFLACYVKLEAKEVPPNPSHSNVCLGPDGDAGAIETKINGFAAQVVNFYTSSANGCPTALTFTATSNLGVLDIGWSGFGHDNFFIGDGAVTVSTSCSGTGPSCGVCTYTGPVDNGPGKLAAHRCSNDSSVLCTMDTDCGVGNRCVFFFGSYFPFAFGGVGLCLKNTWKGPLSGTVDLDTGESAGTERLTTSIFFGTITPSKSELCPKCQGDATVNDGARGGTCSSGVRAGMSCDANGASPNPSLGTTSLDCPPSASDFVNTQTLDLSHSTGNETAILTAASPDCRATGYAGRKCHCDTCDNMGATLCSTDADCTTVGATRCGGNRCVGSANRGAPCTAPSECPGGGCGVPGVPTKPNACYGGADDCVVGDNAPSNGSNERFCASGPFDPICGPVETFRGCFVDSDCPRPGDTCSTGRFRECFDTGTIGDVVTASGHPDVRIAHHAHPTLAALFCMNLTSDGLVDQMGLPGLGRLELQGDVVDNGP
jgi:hypothetical protein